MSLTLNVEEDSPDLYVTGVKSLSVFHELVYHINNLHGINFIKERNSIFLESRKQKATFEWFSLTDPNNSEDYLFLMKRKQQR